MLRMRRASPHGKWIETTRRKPVRAEKKAASFRPDIASRDAPRFGNALRRFSVRRTEKRRNAFPNLGASREAMSGRKLAAFFSARTGFLRVVSIHLPCGDARRMRSISMTQFY